MPPRKETLLGVSGRLKSVVNQRILGVGFEGELCKNGWTDHNDPYVVRRVLWQGVAF